MFYTVNRLYYDFMTTIYISYKYSVDVKRVYKNSTNYFINNSKNRSVYKNKRKTAVNIVCGGKYIKIFEFWKSHMLWGFCMSKHCIF